MHDIPIIYQASNGAIQLKPNSNHETVWTNQIQIADRQTQANLYH